MSTTTKALCNTYTRGRLAWAEGVPLERCPYLDKRGGLHGNIVTGARAFRSKWREGWQDAAAGKAHHYEPAPPRRR